MGNHKKNILYSIILISLIFLVYQFRKKDKISFEEVHISGETMGTVPYNVKYLHPEALSFDKEIDSLLKQFNQSLSTYIPSSEISEFNQGTSIRFRSPFFYPVLKASEQIYEATGGAFDPTIMPLVQAWGFGPQKAVSLDSAQIDSVLQYIGFHKISFDQDSLWKTNPNVQLDFSAIAKGYAVDLIAQYLESKAIHNFMVEVGGELVTKGHNIQKKTWLIGIKNPNYLEEGGKELTAKVQLDNRAMATSGNYLNYYIKDGKKYVHTIDPKSGYPLEQNLLSATVFARDCMTADAFATAFMVLGTEKSKELLNSREDLEGFLIYDEAGKLNVYHSKGLDSLLIP
ncbi:FAD:protein FMN transferase [Rapidithrix thailandica]|uniref:FAD:protein FMN transferase n=1 Tax=Rapidithrix thailandica TaxID=413964 RepID=A0AAW9S7X5_9BACT